MKIYKRLYYKLIQRFKGIPVLIVIYRPWRKGKNVEFTSLAPFVDDEYLSVRFNEIAARIRETQQEAMDKILESEEHR